MKTKLMTLLLASVLASTGSAVAEEPVALPIMRLHVDLALKAAQTTLEACRAQGLNIGVTIIDRGGHVQVQLRDTLAMPITAPISEQKAYAALNFNSPTSALEGRFESPFSPGKLEGLIMSAGGLPITAASTILGGIGVSGAPSGETDEACAMAGLDAIQTDLEMGLM
ncbi:MAG: heme-binding protein [Proteobacteria bacterium]|nr:MAG: heme-binding protein [Pseudomonadota bacterium]